MTGANELPQMAAGAHSHTLYNASDLTEPIATNTANYYEAALAAAEPSDLRGIAQARLGRIPKPQGVIQMATTPRRYVQVFIADTHDQVPLKDCLLYSGEPTLTDLTDQELFYELPIKEILAAHNAKRVKMYDRRVKDRTEMLEPARIRDLKMTVVTIAQF